MEFPFAEIIFRREHMLTDRLDDNLTTVAQAGRFSESVLAFNLHRSSHGCMHGFLKNHLYKSALNSLVIISF